MPRRDVLSALVALAASVLPARTLADEPSLEPSFLSSAVPKDLPRGAPQASLEEAALFAWREFIALSWPAQAGKRDVPRPQKAPPWKSAPVRVWETFRARVEVFPGEGKPFTQRARDYQYDAPPRYVYDATAPGNGTAELAPCPGSQPAATPPWHNLDEANHNHVHASVSPAGPFPGQQILLESKVNRPEYVYVASRGWYGERPIRATRTRTGDYVRSNLKAPPATTRIDAPEDVELVSFPNGTIEVKAAWRRLGPLDDVSRSYVRPVRYYAKDGERTCFIDSSGPQDARDRWGLMAFHIMHKTPSAPYFVWATFEQVDVLLTDEVDERGQPRSAELPDGTPVEPSAAAYTPNVELTSATPTVPQRYVMGGLTPHVPKHQLYFHQPAAFDIPEVSHVAINRRLYPIAPTVRAVNRAVQKLVERTAPDSGLQHYRLVSVQWVPLDKPAGAPYAGPEDPSIYYASNVIIEGPPIAQAFSGQFSHGTSKRSDYLHRELVFLNPKPNPGDPVFLNTFFDGKGYLTGGCMGCHGTRQAYGTDWSFLLDRQRVKAPDVKLTNTTAVPQREASR